MKNILIRADSSSRMGSGHIMRCIILAKGLKEVDSDVTVFFASQDLESNVNYKIIEASCVLCDLQSNSIEELLSLCEELDITLLIVDSYDIDYDDEEKIVKNTKSMVLFFDDIFREHCCDMVVNHGMHVKREMYNGLLAHNTKLFCGSSTTLLRDEFFNVYNNPVKNNNIAIILGGNDVLNLSAKIASLLLEIDKTFNIVILTMSSNKNIEYLQKLERVGLLLDVDNVAEVLSAQKVVICGSGGVLFEVMSLNKKFINICIADNQQGIVDYLEQKDIKTSIGIDELSRSNFKSKLDYIIKVDIYEKLELKFSGNKLAEDILKGML